MFKRRFFSTVAIICVLPAVAAGQSARSIIDEAREKQLERWEGVQSYTVTQTIAGHQTSTRFERAEVVDDNGQVQTVFVPNMPGSAACSNGDVQRMTPDQLDAMGSAYEMTGDALSDEVGSGMEQAGLPRELLSASGGDPWVSADPGAMMSGLGGGLHQMAEGQREMEAESAGQSEEMARNMSEFAERAKLVGTESIDGRKAYHLQAADIGGVQEMEGQEFTVDTLSIWIDTKESVPLQMRMQGTLSDGKEERPLEIMNRSLDYRKVPNSKMYEPYRQQTTISGVMDEAQMAEMREAQKQLEEFEAQMASMPASQRQMMESMMGSQLETMRSMVAGGGFQTEIIVSDIAVNTSGSDDAAVACGGRVGQVQPSPSSNSSGGAKTPQGGDDVVQIVQQNLQALGYEPGNTHGEADTATAIAISKFQAEHGLDVTGEASPQLAGYLMAESDRRQGGGAAAAAAAPPRDPATLQAAQQACLQEKMAAAQEKQKKKRGLGRLMSAVSRTALGSGDYDLANKTRDIYNASATAEDLSAAAKDLGLTESDIEACQNPG